MIDEKNKRGRPTKYLPEMCETVIKLMKEGCSKTVLAAYLEINLDTIYDWCNKYPDFSESIKRGTLLSEAWWEENGRLNLQNKEFNSTLWYMNMKNRFGWSDKVQNDTTLNIKQEDAIKLLG